MGGLHCNSMIAEVAHSISGATAFLRCLQRFMTPGKAETQLAAKKPTTVEPTYLTNWVLTDETISCFRTLANKSIYGYDIFLWLIIYVMCHFSC